MSIYQFVYVLLRSCCCSFASSELISTDSFYSSLSTLAPLCSLCSAALSYKCQYLYFDGSSPNHFPVPRQSSFDMSSWSLGLCLQNYGSKRLHEEPLFFTSTNCYFRSVAASLTRCSKVSTRSSTCFFGRRRRQRRCGGKGSDRHTVRRPSTTVEA